MIKILFFAQLREQLNCEQFDLDNSNLASVDDVKARLLAIHPEWSKFLCNKKVMVAVNQTMSSLSAKIASGDEVAFFPPVTGG